VPWNKSSFYLIIPYNILYYSPDSERNQALYEKIKGILKKEHGGENCQWTDLQMEGLFLSNTIYLRKNPEFVKHSIHSKFYCRLDTLTL